MSDKKVRCILIERFKERLTKSTILPLQAVIFAFFVASLTFCSPSQAVNKANPTTTESLTASDPTPPNARMPDDWQFRWLKGIPCSPPCWEGITPGTTVGIQAEALLGKSPIVASTSVYTFTDYVSVGWDWVSGTRGGAARYDNLPSDQTIYGIWPIYHDLFRFRDISEAFGEPSHVMARAYKSPFQGKTLTQVWIIYLDRGFLLWTEQKDLDKDTAFWDLAFFVPTLNGLAKVEPWARFHPDWVIPWQGFKGFDFYCRDELNGRECREAG